MDQTLSITLGLAGIAAIVLVLRMIGSRRRTRELRRRFGEEYARLVRERPENRGRAGAEEPGARVRSFEQRQRRQSSR